MRAWGRACSYFVLSIPEFFEPHTCCPENELGMMKNWLRSCDSQRGVGSQRRHTPAICIKRLSKVTKIRKPYCRVLQQIVHKLVPGTWRRSSRCRSSPLTFPPRTMRQPHPHWFVQQLIDTSFLFRTPRNLRLLMSWQKLNHMYPSAKMTS